MRINAPPTTDGITPSPRRAPVEPSGPQDTGDPEPVVLLQHFLINMSHDLMSPLTVLKATVYLLEEEITTEAQQEYTRQIEKQAERLEKMIRDMQTMSRLLASEALQFRAGDLNRLVGSVVTAHQPLAISQGQHLDFQPDESLPPVRFDQATLERALANLVENALKYTPEGGQIVISTLRHGQEALLQVQDTGCGILPADLPHVFERFYRARAHDTRARGSGLGLSIVREVAEAHGGRVEATSEPDQGSTFRLWLPLEEEAETPPNGNGATVSAPSERPLRPPL